MSAPAEMAERTRGIFDRQPEPYAGVDLHPAERRLLAEVGPRWGQVAMLDLGVGSGRTTLTFGAICGEYVGIDFSPAMVRRAREHAAAIPRARIDQGDARDLSAFAAGHFDVVLFSFNGLDAVDHDDRRRVLREVARVLKPRGRFVFSSHNLIPPWERARPATSLRRPVFLARVWLGALRRRVRFRAANGAIDWNDVTRRGHAVFVEAHDYALPQYFVTPTECARQVAEAGLVLDAVVAMDGTDLAAPHRAHDPWLFYWCTKPS